MVWSGLVWSCLIIVFHVMLCYIYIIYIYLYIYIYISPYIYIYIYRYISLLLNCGTGLGPTWALPGLRDQKSFEIEKSPEPDRHHRETARQNVVTTQEKSRTPDNASTTLGNNSNKLKDELRTLGKARDNLSKY